jgi:WD40 repeat protein
VSGVSKTSKPGIAWEPRWQAQIGDHVIALAWSPDGAILAAAAVGGPITLCDGQTGRIRHVLPGHGFGTSGLSWCPHGTLLASAGQDGTVRLWDAENGKEHLALDAGADWVERVAWSPDGMLLASAASRKVRLWNPTGQLVREYANHPSTVADIQWKPGTRELASAAYGELAVWNPDKPEPLQLFRWKGSMLVLAWSPDGEYIATGDQDSTVHFWIVKTGKDLMMSGYPTKVRELAWDSTSRYLATGGGAVPCVWDVSGKGPAGTEPLQFAAHRARVTALAFQHSGPMLASAGADGLVALWQPGKQKRVLTHASYRSAITQIGWSRDDHRLALGTESGMVAVHAWQGV